MRDRIGSSAALTLAIVAGVACGGDAHTAKTDPLDVVVPSTSSDAPLPVASSASPEKAGCGSLDTLLRKRPDAEIKNTLGAIARSAVSSFERELVAVTTPSAVTHQLCESAVPFPSKIPTCGPTTLNAGLFDTPSSGGTDTVGWRCLRFRVDSPVSARFGYVKGGPYRGPSVGGPDPGKDGFEAWAEEDLDGDGRTKLYTLTGTLVGDVIRIAPSVFVSDAD